MASDVGTREYGPSDFIAAGARGLNGRVQVRAKERSFGGLSLLSVSGQPLEIMLEPEAGEVPLIDFIFIGGGDFAYRNEGVWVPLEATLVVAPNGISRHLRLTGEWSFVAARVPREAMEAFVPELPSSIGTFAKRSLLDCSMQEFVSTVLESAQRASSIESYAVEQLVLEMGGALLLDRMGGGWSQGSPKAVLRDRAMAVIAQQCSDPELNPARVAHAVQSSLRQLQVVFSDAGTSVAAEIRRQRARLARSLLMDSRYDVLGIEQLAERSGFGTTMSMRRALTELYGSGPRELRRCRGGAAAVVAQ
ncbi:helix-turn-helix domain-containing protein [Leucobacter sp. CSA1]|uniref:Helix-turn-helix domain-containing protein n=1 Tax=Leucobacter chromiisoli TaxID=2796471 RepID=A0A934UVH1_9MICO|nr:helix-turn-helix domain-containing protein [Leucobacter chromiisoli]MBK0419466.1 helix-turn-helix domain-containing protein [Leucobacter chromiisoli]